ncbi:MAG TPA: hypothetical protein VGJ13_17055 [Pseudonocardiaceae bacterium]|jgi:hypothetical protein
MLSDLDVELIPLSGNHRGIVAWMLVAFLLTFLGVRGITKWIRAGRRGPFRNTRFGGVHVHHQVYGIFLMLAAATGEFTYRPDRPWVQLLAVLFGMGAALTLDEFALWLHLEDVYWTAEGRRSVNAVLIALAIGGLLLIGANPLGENSADSRQEVLLTITVNLIIAVIAVLKGRPAMGLIGVFVPLLAVVAVVRLARPTSPWARCFYRPESRLLARSLQRFPPGGRSRWDPVVDFFAAPHPVSHPASDRVVRRPG